jgi:seryl-tRNA synthetase
MLDIKFIRDNPEKVKKTCEAKRVKADIDELLDIDRRRREALQGIEDMRSKKNKANKEIQKAASQREKNKIILEMKELDRNSDRLGKTLRDLEKKFNKLMCRIPNVCLEGVPVGGEEDSLILEKIGEKPKFDFKIKDYMEIGESLGLLDIKRAAKITGTRFGFLNGKAVLMEMALVNFAFDLLVKKGFIPVIPPVMIKSEMAMGMGFIQQTDDEEAYYLPKDDLYLTATSEQALGSMHSGEVFEEKDLVKRYAGFSTCFRREAGSYGKDTKGIFRVHQFDKVEMFSFTRPEDSEKEHKFLLEIQKELMNELKLPYQVVNIASGDLGMPAAAKYDIETWIPSENRYRETHSTSNCTDFQARRLNIRYRNKKGELVFVHTLNGTAFAMGRMIIAILENYQQKGGSVRVPEVLQKYLNFKEIK